MIIDSICHGHVGSQQMIEKENDDSDALTLPLGLVGCMIRFRHRLPTTEEVVLKQHCLTQGDAPWNLSLFSDQVADNFYQQVIDTDSYNASSKKNSGCQILMRLTRVI